MTDVTEGLDGPPEGGAVSDVAENDALESLFGDVPSDPAPAEAARVEEPQEEVTEPPETDGEETEAQPEDAGEQSEDEQPTLYDLPLPGGEKRQVTLEELQKHALMGIDHTQKTMRLSEQVKQRETQLDQREAALIEEIQRLNGQNSDPMPQWDDSDPIGSMEAFTKWQQRETIRQQENAERQSRHAEIAQRQQAEQAQAAERAMDTLLTEFPEWRDPEKAAAAAQEHNKVWQHAGYSPDEIAAIAASGDARAVKVIRLAAIGMKALDANKRAADSKVAGKPPVAAPAGRRPVDPAAKLRARALSGDEAAQDELLNAAFFAD